MSKKHTVPKRGDTYVDDVGEVKCLGVVDGYVVVRRKGCAPILLYLSEWNKRVEKSRQGTSQ